MRYSRALAGAFAAMVVAGGCGSGGSVDSAGSNDHGGSAGHGSPSPGPSSTGPAAPVAPGAPAGAGVIEVEMVDDAFKPTQVQVRPGQSVTFRFTNTGKARHEAVIGDEAAQLDHHGSMGSGGGHGGLAVTVEPGATGDLTYTSDGKNGILIGCHEPGHWEAGMKATIISG